jgi:hypothetical protein
MALNISNWAGLKTVLSIIMRFFLCKCTIIFWNHHLFSHFSSSSLPFLDPCPLFGAESLAKEGGVWIDDEEVCLIGGTGELALKVLLRKHTFI